MVYARCRHFLSEDRFEELFFIQQKHYLINPKRDRKTKSVGWGFSGTKSILLCGHLILWLFSPVYINDFELILVR